MLTHGRRLSCCKWTRHVGMIECLSDDFILDYVFETVIEEDVDDADSC